MLLGKQNNLVAWVAVVVLFSIAAAAAEENSDLAKFNEWFQSYQLANKLTVREISPGHRGVFANVDMEEDEIIFQIPWHKMLTSEKIILDYKEITDLLKLTSDVAEDDVIAIFLAYARYGNIKHQTYTPWINVLPETVNNALYFADDEVKLLEGSHAYTQFENIRTTVTNDFEKYSFIFQNTTLFPRAITFDQWRWAYAIVLSRRVVVASTEAFFTAVAPFFDFFNHMPDEVPSWGYHSWRLMLHAEATSGYEKGDQVYMNYGQLCNDELLEDYGFIVEDNIDACVHISVTELIETEDLSDATKFDEKKLAKLNALNIKDFSLKLMPRGSLSKQLLNAAWLLADPKETLKEDERVIIVVNWLRALVERKLKKYPTTIAQDEELVNSQQFKAMSVFAQMAIKLRLEEKQILNDTLNVLAQKVKQTTQTTTEPTTTTTATKEKSKEEL